MAHAAAEEKTTTGQDQANDPIGDWVVNTVGLPQYKDAFKALFRNSNLENIGTVSSSTFEKAIIKMMGDNKIDFGHLSQFTGAHSKLSQPQSVGLGGLGASFAKEIAKEVGKEVGVAFGEALNNYDIGRTYDRISSGNTEARKLFRSSLMNFYGDAEPGRCMITGKRGTKNDRIVPSHIIPSSCSRSLIRRLNEGYSTPFNKDSARNGLLLLDYIDSWFEHGKFVIIYDALNTKDYFVKSISNECSYLDNSKLQFPCNPNGTRKKPNNNPYHRALKFHFEDSIRVLTDSQKEKYGWNDPSTTPWTSVVELSEKESIVGDPDELKNDDGSVNTGDVVNDS